MADKCFDCEGGGPLHKHHVFGKEVDPKSIVYLCPNCHFRVHYQGLLLYKNAASDQFNEWLDAEESKRYVKRAEMMTALDVFGYVPAFDGWEDHSSAHEMAKRMYIISPVALRNYLVEVDRLDLWPSGKCDG